MKKVLSLLALVSMLGVSYAKTTTASTVTQAAPSDAHCQYKLSDAEAGLKSLVLLGFVPRSQSPDGNRVMGAEVYHNPKSKNPESQDAYALVVIDKATGGKLTLIVMYVGPVKSVLYKREIKNKALGPCFEKSEENTPAQKPQ